MTRDPGLQPERTAIAWSRTALSFAANGLLLVPRLVHAGDDPAVLTMVAVTVVLAVYTGLVAVRRGHQLRAATRPDPPRAMPFVVVAAGVTVLGVLLSVWVVA
jgi:uncharacterized membrane protein YidH (DUF202 family)